MRNGRFGSNNGFSEFARDQLNEGLSETIGGYDILRERLGIENENDNIRGAILEAAATVGEDSHAIEGYLLRYKLLKDELERRHGPNIGVDYSSLIRTAAKLFDDNYLGVELPSKRKKMR